MNPRNEREAHASLQGSWLDRHIAECPQDMDIEDEIVSPLFGLAMKACAVLTGLSMLIAFGLMVKGCA